MKGVLIQNATIVNEGKRFIGDVLVEGERIVKVTPSEERRAQGTGHRAESTGQRAQGTGHRDAVFRIPDPGSRIPDPDS
ncbi:MAG: hypothetical protein IH596_02545 [Bacteroidales bacterium]|nr:hypothetical protein [Bacteroidales bacterium]